MVGMFFQSFTDAFNEMNELAYRLALNECDALNVLNLNNHWHRLMSECQQRFRTMQTYLLQQQHFLNKCQSWLSFVNSIEQDLVCSVAGNLPDLVTQLKKCQVRHLLAIFCI